MAGRPSTTASRTCPVTSSSLDTVVADPHAVPADDVARMYRALSLLVSKNATAGCPDTSASDTDPELPPPYPVADVAADHTVAELSVARMYRTFVDDS